MPQDLTEEWALTTFEGGEDPVLIRRVRETFGWLGNMSPHSVVMGVSWHHAEGLFQALRFSDPQLREQIRSIKNPMDAKRVSQSFAVMRTVEPLSPEDLDNMRMCLRLKIEQHPHLREALLATQGRRIIEDCSKRQRGTGLFWGAAERSPGVWHGQNWLGRLWAEQRSRLQAQEDFFDGLMTGNPQPLSED